MGERELARRREPVRREPAQLDEVVARPSGSIRPRGPGQAEDDPAVVGLEPVPEELPGLDHERSLLADLAAQAVERDLVLLQEAAGQIPAAGRGIVRAPAEQNPSRGVEADRLDAGHGVRVPDVAARSALRALAKVVDSLAADGTEPPT